MARRNTTIQLFSTGRVDPTYKNIIAFNSVDQRNDYLGKCPSFLLTGCKYWRIGNPINIPISFNNAFIYDYCKITNHFGEESQEEYYCFIAGRTYLNDNLTMFAVSVDWVQTYYFSTSPDGGKLPFYYTVSGFCNMSTDQNLLPPRGTTSEYPAPEIMSQFFDYNNYGNSVVIFSTIDLRQVITSQTVGSYITGYTDNGILAAYPYLLYSGTGGDLSLLTAEFNLINTVLNNNGVTDAITGIYMIPNYFITGLAAGSVVLWSDNYIQEHTVTIEQPIDIGTYTPKNKSLLGYEYTYITVNNGQGETEKYNFEDFTGPATFILGVSVAAGSPVLTCRPGPNYKYGNVNEYRQRMMKITQAPSVSWVNDSYRIWLAQTQDSRREAIQSANLAINQAVEARDKSWAYRAGGIVHDIEDALRDPLVEGVATAGGMLGYAAGGISNLLGGNGVSFSYKDQSGVKQNLSFGKASGAGVKWDENGKIVERSYASRSMEGAKDIVKPLAGDLVNLGYMYLNHELGIENTYTYDQAIISSIQNLDVLMASYADKARVPATASGSNAYGDLLKYQQYGFMFTVFSPSEEYARLIDNLLSSNGHFVNQYVSSLTKHHGTFDYYKFTYSLVLPNPADRPEFARRLLMSLLNNGVYLWYPDVTNRVTDKFGAPYGITNNEV